MFEYTGNEVTAYYFNRVIFDNYLTDKERNLIIMLDHFRYETFKHNKDYPHTSWYVDRGKREGNTYYVSDVSLGANDEELFMRFFSILMQLKDHTYELYAEENKDNPEKIIADLKETLKEITPKVFYDDVIESIAKPVKGEWNVDRLMKEGDKTVFLNDLHYICKPMLLAIDSNGSDDLKKKANTIIEKKQTSIVKYTMKKRGLV